MVDSLYYSEACETSRQPFKFETRSRRSSISSATGSDSSVFSAASVTSTVATSTSALSSGQEISNPYDSDDEGFAQSLEQLGCIGNEPLDENYASSAPQLPHFAPVTSNLGDSDTERCDGSRVKDLQRQSHDQNQHLTNQPFLQSKHISIPSGISETFWREALAHKGPKKDGRNIPYRPCGTDQASSTRLQSSKPPHPRRTSTDPGWSRPSLIRQEEQRSCFVENLVDTATQLVALIWPTSATPVPVGAQKQGSSVISLRYFIRETLRRSKTSFSTLQTALYYLALLNYSGRLPKCDFTSEQRMDSPSSRALQCGRRMFLASLILASKYLQDRNYTNKAWSRISSLPVAEINRNEMVFLSVLEYRLHFKSGEFQRWNDLVSPCTTRSQQGVLCPWEKILKAMQLWREVPKATAQPQPSQVCDLSIDYSHTHDAGATPARARTLPLPGYMGRPSCPPAMLRGLASLYPVNIFSQHASPTSTSHAGHSVQTTTAITDSPESLDPQELPSRASCASNFERPTPSLPDPSLGRLPVSPPKTPTEPDETSRDPGNTITNLRLNENLIHSRDTGTVPPAPRLSLMPSPSISPEPLEAPSSVSLTSYRVDAQYQQNLRDAFAGPNDSSAISLRLSGATTNAKYQPPTVQPDPCQASDTAALQEYTRRCLAASMKSIGGSTLSHNASHSTASTLAPHTVHDDLKKPAALIKETSMNAAIDIEEQYFSRCNGVPGRMSKRHSSGKKIDAGASKTNTLKSCKSKVREKDAHCRDYSRKRSAGCMDGILPIGFGTHESGNLPRVKILRT